MIGFASGNKGLITTCILAVAMTAAGSMFFNIGSIEGSGGIALPSPNVWQLPQLTSACINLLLIILIGIIQNLLNKRFSIVAGGGCIFSSIFILLTASCPWLTDRIVSSTLVAAVNIICLWILLSAKERRNASEPIFLIATFLSIGSMFQYAYLLYMPVYIIGALTVKAFRFKEFLAMLMGIVAPYWTGLGLGLISIDDLRVPQFIDIFSAFESKSDLLMVFLTAGITCVATLLVSMSNLVKLYTSNSHVRMCNSVLLLIGFASALFMILDFTNLTAYAETLFMISGFQIAIALSPGNPPRDNLVMFITSVVYISMFVLTVNL